MDKAVHTPGPWAITGVSMSTGNVSVGHKGQRIVIADVTNAASFGDMLSGAMRRGGGGFSQSDCATQFANASLITAAPDMFEALHACHKFLSKQAPNNDALLDLIDAALAKAAPTTSDRWEGL